MLVERIWVNNSLRNYCYLVACPETGEALAIDPLDSEKTLHTAKVKGWQITQVLNTHEHFDHTGGNAAVIAATGAKLIAHHKAKGKIEGVSQGVGAGDVLKIGKTVELECLDTPGHTFCHICLRAHGDEPALFSGDTVFNAGAGNVHNGGDVNLLYQSFTEQIAKLPGNTRLYAGHDYLENNLKFTLSREAGNSAAAALLAQASTHSGAQAPVTTLAQELEVNTFMRLQNESVIEGLRSNFPDLPARPDAKTVFTKLRELRNKW
jgi:hydroxyacylglutathione hydrolase